MKDLKYLNKYLLKYKFHLIFGSLFIIVGNFFSIVPAVVVRYAFDYLSVSYEFFRAFDGFRLQSGIPENIGFGILFFFIIIIASALIRAVLLFFMRQTIIVMSRLIEYDLKNEIYDHYQSLPLSFYRKNNTGDLMARISEDVSKVRMYIGPAIMYGINLFTLFAMVIPFMISINPTLTFYSLLPLPVLSVSIYFVSDIINKRSIEIQESLSGLSTFVQEAFSGIRVIKAFVREEEVASAFAEESNKYKDHSLKLAFVQALFMPLIMGLIGLSVILTVYIGSIQVLNGEVSTGNIAEFIIYVNMLTWPVTALGWITSIIQRSAASQKRINEFLETKTDLVSARNLKKEIEGKILFDSVSFTYPDSGIQALSKVSFEVNPGESIAIVGTTGSGKSTVANIVCRLYDISDGSLKIDGVDIKDFDLSSLRSQIGYVPQDIFLFSDSIENNISFGNRKMSREAIEQAAKDADVLDNILDFKHGFQTQLGERGITLSGGQKQRVSIARAIAREPKVLILDDALSAVDTKTENAILGAMQRIMQGRTSIVISHRVSSARLADKVVMLDDGEVIEQGKHEELLAMNGAYKKLYDKQLAGEEVAD
ncbi:MAG: ABC transporter ATP-binding protein [Ekhidna sp.]|nr:ABC transporter ATP-binding protein [Ekhidna sp.]MBC6427509.1 ABC transporter ATP-binding protein [Ekhidna sp.]